MPIGQAVSSSLLFARSRLAPARGQHTALKHCKRRRQATRGGDGHRPQHTRKTCGEGSATMKVTAKASWYRLQSAFDVARGGVLLHRTALRAAPARGRGGPVPQGWLGSWTATEVEGTPLVCSAQVTLKYIDNWCLARSADAVSPACELLGLVSVANVFKVPAALFQRLTQLELFPERFPYIVGAMQLTEHR